MAQPSAPAAISRRLSALALIAVLVGLGCSVAPKAAYLRCPLPAAQGVVAPPVGPTMPTISAGAADSAASVAPGFGGERLKLRTLVVASTGEEPAYRAIAALLTEIGVPFTSLILARQPLSADLLRDGPAAGRYNAIVLATDDVVPGRGGGDGAELPSAAWDLLQDYRRRFGVRQVILQATLRQDRADYGLAFGDAPDGRAAPVEVALTDAGLGIFRYLNGATPLAIGGRAWLGYPEEGYAVTPLLQTDDGQGAGLIKEGADGAPPSMVLLMEQERFFRHSTLLGYGVVNWVNQGLFVGERHVYLAVQPDDYFIPNRLWDPDLDRMGDDRSRVARRSAADRRFSAGLFCHLTHLLNCSDSMTDFPPARFDAPPASSSTTISPANPSPPPPDRSPPVSGGSARPAVDNG